MNVFEPSFCFVNLFFITKKCWYVGIAQHNNTEKQLQDNSAELGL